MKRIALSCSPVSLPSSDSKIIELLQKSFSTNLSPPPNIRSLKQTHAKLIRTREIENTLTVGKLISDIASSHHSNLKYAHSIFTQIQSPLNIFIWNSLIRGYAHSLEPKEAIFIFRLMLSSGYSPNNYTYPFAIKASAHIRDPCVGLSLHGSVIIHGFEDSDQFIQTALVNFYATYGFIECAYKLFDRCPSRDVTTWNALIKGYIGCEKYNQAINVFQKMYDSKVKCDEITMLSVVSACGHLGALDMGRWLHSYIKKNRINMSLNLETVIINMYLKCGEIEVANVMFDEMKEKDIRAWSVMISGLATNGHGKEALKLFHIMQSLNINPDSVTLTAVLSACSHAGLVEEGMQLLEDMSTNFHVNPTIEHYGCVVDLLGRAGKLKEALDLINALPIKPDVALWGALLVACRVHKSVEFGEMVAKKMLELDPSHVGAHVFLSNVYASSKKWSLVDKIRTSMKAKKIYKPPGSSSIEVKGVVYEFLSGDKSKPESFKIYKMLDEIQKIVRQKGYKVMTRDVAFDVDEEDKEVCVSQHSEKLAVAFGLINTKHGERIRVVKNLRICEDCHNVMKIVSEHFEREVVIRDRNRFHHFRDGSCSCGDYW